MQALESLIQIAISDSVYHSGQPYKITIKQSTLQILWVVVILLIVKIQIWQNKQKICFLRN